MKAMNHQDLEARVLMLAPTAEDWELTQPMLARAGIACVNCVIQLQLVQELMAGAGVVLIAEEAVHGDNSTFIEWLGQQPPWSDLPVLVLALAGADSPAVAQAMADFGNVTIVERPVRNAAFVSVVRSALRARRRQYQLQGELVQREHIAKRLDMAMAAAHAGSWQINLMTGKLSASDRAVQLHGLLPGTSLTQERAMACVHPDDRTSTAAALQRTIENGLAFRHEYRVLQSDGSLRFVSSQAERQGTGEQTRVVGLVQDITERRLAEDVLRYSEQLHRIAFDQSPTGMVYVRADGRFTKVNAAMCGIVGYHAGELLGMTVSDLTHPDDRAGDAELIDPFLRGDTLTYDNDKRYVRKDGSVCWVAVTARMVKDANGRPLHTVGVIRDITERKQADDTLKAIDEMNRSLMDGSVDCVKVLDMDGLLLHINAPGLCLMEIDDFGPLSGQEWSVLWPVEVHQDIAQALTTARSGKNYAFHAFCPTVKGTPRWWDVVVSPVRDASNGPVVRLLSVSRDITERRQAEAALRTSEERFRTLFELMDEGFCVVDMVFDEQGRPVDYRVLEMNPAFEKHTGNSGLLGMSMREAIPDLEEFWYTTYGRVAATGESIRFVRATGLMGGRWFDVYAFRLGEAGSNKVAILFNDITASRQAQETVKANEARNAYLLKLADTLRPLSDPTAVQAEASRVLGEQLGANRVFYFEVRSEDYLIERDYTKAALSMVGSYPITSFGPNPLAVLRAGRTASEADTNVSPVRPPEEKAAFAGLQIRSYIAVPLVKSGTFVAGLAVHADCVRPWTLTEIAMVEDTAERTWAAVERVRAETALRASQGRLRLALDAAELGTWHVDMTSRLTRTDERFRAIFGIIGESTDYLKLFAIIHPDDLSAVERSVAAATRLENPEPYAVEYRIIHPDGAVRWVFAKGATSYEDKEGNKVSTFDGTMQDITARKLIEQEREQLVAQLRDADRHKDEFLATLAHELRNPLAPLRNGLQLIKLADRDGTVEQARAMMDRQLTQLVRLVDDLMDVSRVTSGKLELRKERTELRAVIDAAVETSHEAIVQAEHALIIDVPGEPIFVDADAARLAQVVSNLLNNSAKYTHRGGRIWLTASREGSTAVLSVRDNGIGIPTAMLGRVFDMFTQVDRTLEKTTGGLGIGLSLAKGLLHMHDGTIEARSDGEGMGCEFVIRLPAAMAHLEVPEPAKSPAGEVEPSARRRILVVDDNVDAADSLGCLLEVLGHEVRIANDGEAGVAVARQFQPDMVLMDIGMPKLNGYEAASRIRQQPWGQAMVLVALTGWGQADDRRKSANAGFDHHLVKPIDMDDLLKLLSGES